MSEEPTRAMPKWMPTALACGFIGLALGCGDQFSPLLSCVGVVAGFSIGVLIGMWEQQRKRLR